jgi:hypothetical protein
VTCGGKRSGNVGRSRVVLREVITPFRVSRWKAVRKDGPIRSLWNRDLNRRLVQTVKVILREPLSNLRYTSSNHRVIPRVVIRSSSKNRCPDDAFTQQFVLAGKAEIHDVTEKNLALLARLKDRTREDIAR